MFSDNGLSQKIDDQSHEKIYKSNNSSKIVIPTKKEFDNSIEKLKEKFTSKKNTYNSLEDSCSFIVDTRESLTNKNQKFVELSENLKNN